MLHNVAEQILDKLATQPPVLTEGRAMPVFRKHAIAISTLTVSRSAAVACECCSWLCFEEYTDVYTMQIRCFVIITAEAQIAQCYRVPIALGNISTVTLWFPQLYTCTTRMCMGF